MFGHEGSKKFFLTSFMNVSKAKFHKFQNLLSEFIFPPKSPEILTDLLNNYNPFLLISWEIVRKS